MNASVTDLLAIIGKLHVENSLLQSKVAYLQKALAEKSTEQPADEPQDAATE